MSRFDRRLSGTPAVHGAHGKPKGTPCSVQQALGWAFGLEKAQREFPEPRDAERTLCYGFGLKYVRMQRAALGCKVDGGQFKGGSYTHPDAGVISAHARGFSGRSKSRRCRPMITASLPP